MIENCRTLAPFVTNLHTFGKLQLLRLKGWICNQSVEVWIEAAVHHQNCQMIYQCFSSAFKASLTLKHHVILVMTSCKCLVGVKIFLKHYVKPLLSILVLLLW